MVYPSRFTTEMPQLHHPRPPQAAVGPRGGPMGLQHQQGRRAEGIRRRQARRDGQRLGSRHGGGACGPQPWRGQWCL